MGRVIQNFSETAMNTRLLLRHGVGIVAGCFLAGLTVFSAPVYASQTFTSNIGPNGEHASATFTTGLNSITLVLTDLQTDLPSIAQLLSDISFSVSGGGAITTPTPTPSGQLIHCADGGCANVAGTANPWTLALNSGVGTGTYLLTGLVGSNKTLIIGPTTATYCNPTCPDGIGSNNFNTFLKQTGTFILGITGVTSASVITDVAFSFGTGPETVVGVPIPAAVWLFVSGLVGLIGIARRRQPGMAMAPALAA